MRTPRSLLGLGLVALLATGASAQNSGPAAAPTPPAAKPTTDSTAVAPAPISLFRAVEIQHVRPADSRGLNVFEWPKNDDVPFKGFALSIGGAFLQDFQEITHEKTADAKMVSGVNADDF